MENDYDIWISNNRRIAGCVRFGAAYDKKSISEILSSRGGGIFLWASQQGDDKKRYRKCICKRP